MDKKKLGYYAGYIMSSFYLGQLPGCLFWGWIADRSWLSSCVKPFVFRHV